MEASFSSLIKSLLAMLSEVENFMTLEDNDIIISGTPKGVGTYSIGDQFVGQVFSGETLLVEKEWIVE